MASNFLAGRYIRLRAMEPSDIEILYSWENDTSIWKVSDTLTPFSRFQIEEFVANSKQDIYATRQMRLMIDLAGPTVQKTSIGSIDLFDFDPFHLRAGIGILIREDYRQLGYATEALNIFLAYVKTTLHLHQVFCNIQANNEGSIRLFENAGFIRCGIKKEWIKAQNGFSDEWMYQLLLKYE